MTKDAQAALRRTIEAHSKVTRFCMICNYVSRIIEPLASRCAKFRFKPLATEAMEERLQFILKEEKLEAPPEVIAKVLQVAHGDMRKAVTTLQSVFTLCGGSSSGSSGGHGVAVTPKKVEEVAGVLPMDDLERLWDAIKSNSFDRLQETLESIFLEGYAAPTVLGHLLERVVASKELSDGQKGRICVALGRVDKCLTNGASDSIQLLDGAAEAMRVFNQV